MYTFLSNFKFIIGFLILVFVVQTFAGEKNSQHFVLLVLFSMLIFNADKFGNYITNFFSDETKTNSQPDLNTNQKPTTT